MSILKIREKIKSFSIKHPFNLTEFKDYIINNCYKSKVKNFYWFEVEKENKYCKMNKFF